MGRKSFRSCMLRAHKGTALHYNGATWYRAMSGDKKHRITRKMLNEALRARGREESLREGDGYFYFGGGEAVHWLSSSVMAKKISDLTLEQWLKEFDRLLANEKKLRSSMKPVKKQSHKIRK